MNQSGSLDAPEATAEHLFYLPSASAPSTHQISAQVRCAEKARVCQIVRMEKGRAHNLCVRACGCARERERERQTDRQRKREREDVCVRERDTPNKTPETRRRRSALRTRRFWRRHCDGSGSRKRKTRQGRVQAETLHLRIGGVCWLARRLLPHPGGMRRWTEVGRWKQAMSRFSLRRWDEVEAAQAPLVLVVARLVS